MQHIRPYHIFESVGKSITIREIENCQHRIMDYFLSVQDEGYNIMYLFRSNPDTGYIQHVVLVQNCQDLDDDDIVTGLKTKYKDVERQKLVIGSNAGIRYIIQEKGVRLVPDPVVLPLINELTAKGYVISSDNVIPFYGEYSHIIELANSTSESSSKDITTFCRENGYHFDNNLSRYVKKVSDNYNIHIGFKRPDHRVSISMSHIKKEFVGN